MSPPLPNPAAPSLAPFVGETRRGIAVRVHVVAGARNDRIEGIIPEAGGGMRLKVAVRAAADRGRANAAVIALLAREWDLPKSCLTIAAGASTCRKTIDIAGDPAAAARSLASWANRRFPV